MPGFDRTGPRGFGPMTGRRMGYCRGGRRVGFRSGFRRGFRRGVAPITKDEEKEMLEEEVEALQKRIKELESEE